MNKEIAHLNLKLVFTQYLHRGYYTVARRYTPLGSRMKWRMEAMSGLVPSKTIAFI